MCTVTLSYDKNNVQARQMLAALLSSGLFITESEEKDLGNRVYIENGEVKTDIVTETVELEEMRKLLHEMVDLEYSLP